MLEHPGGAIRPCSGAPQDRCAEGHLWVEYARFLERCLDAAEAELEELRAAEPPSAAAAVAVVVGPSWTDEELDEALLAAVAPEPGRGFWDR